MIAKKYDGSANRKGGRPKISQVKIDWVLKMTDENSFWGAGRISNNMKYLGMEISKSSVWRIMEDNGYGPDARLTSKGIWDKFIRSQFDVLAATDFFSIELLRPKGLVCCMVLYVIVINKKSAYRRYSC